MMGFYVYCIRAKNKKKISGYIANGVEFGGNVSTIFFREIEVIVSNIDFLQFNEKKIKEKLQEDVKWAEENVRRHHDIVAEASATGAVIPMKFGTIFKTKKSLESMLKNHYERFLKLLAELEGKQEWGVKIYLEYEKFIEFLKKKNSGVKEKEERKSTLSAGMQWYADKKNEESVAAQFDEEIEKQIQSFVEKLEDFSEQIIFCDLLPKEAAEGINKDNIFNAACLINNDKLACFKKMLKEIQNERDQIGFTFIASGPWPPYNFVQQNDAET
ncbi:MAG: GvpL/GvpF family gas vesicle protein [bacterium]